MEPDIKWSLKIGWCFPVIMEKLVGHPRNTTGGTGRRWVENNRTASNGPRYWSWSHSASVVVSPLGMATSSIAFQTRGSIYYRQGGAPLVQLSYGALYMALDTRHVLVAPTMWSMESPILEIDGKTKFSVGRWVSGGEKQSSIVEMGSERYASIIDISIVNISCLSFIVPTDI